MKVDFKNSQYDQFLSSTNISQASKHSKSIASNFIIRSELFFELFPFHIIFKKSLEIISIGDGLNQAMKNIEGETLRDLFNINRPMIHAFTWENVILPLNKLFRRYLILIYFSFTFYLTDNSSCKQYF